MTDIPAAAARARQMYIENAPTRLILAETGLSPAQLYRWIGGGPKKNGRRLLPDLRRRRRARRHVAKSARVALVTRMMRAAERQVCEIERRLAREGAEPGERAREARLMAVLVKTLRELTALDALQDGGSGQQDCAQQNDDVPRDLDELRRELSRRIDRLHAARTNGAGGDAEP